MDQGQQGQTGQQKGGNINVSVGEFGEWLVTELQGRSFQQTYRGNKFVCSTAGGGLQLAATQLFSTTFATFTPILGIYNPSTNLKAASLTRIWCGLTASPLATAAQTGSFVLVSCLTSPQIITNAQTATPVNCQTLKASGSSMIGITGAALTGYLPTSAAPQVVRPITGNICVSTATASITELGASMIAEESAGGILVVPGQFIGIATGISNAVAGMLVTAGLEWDEVVYP